MPFQIGPIQPGKKFFFVRICQRNQLVQALIELWSIFEEKEECEYHHDKREGERKCVLRQVRHLAQKKHAYHLAPLQERAGEIAIHDDQAAQPFLQLAAGDRELRQILRHPPDPAGLHPEVDLFIGGGRLLDQEEGQVEDRHDAQQQKAQGEKARREPLTPTQPGGQSAVQGECKARQNHCP